MEVLGQHIEGTLALERPPFGGCSFIAAALERPLKHRDPGAEMSVKPLLQRLAEAAFPRPQEDVADQQGLHIVREMLR